MIKIERLKDGAKVFVVTEGARRQVYLNQLITNAEFDTIEVEGGTLVYSVDETEVKELQGQGKQLTLNLTEIVQDTVVTTDVAETVQDTTVITDAPETITTALQPVVVKPTPRTKK
jgi:hypothetical protein